MTGDVEASNDIVVRRVSKWFHADKRQVHALDELDLHVPSGSFVSIIGPSGCGKSTLLRLVGGLLDADGGTISVAGVSPDAARARKRFAFVPQQPALVPWRTVRGNVALLGELNRGANESVVSADDQLELIEHVGLTPFLGSFPRELSGGLQQRVSIVRAFALGAPVMLMDEPFSALDEITRVELRQHLLDLWRRTGSTVLFVTHSIAEAVALSDRVVVLGSRPGRVVADIDVELPRPRPGDVEDSAAFHDRVGEIRAARMGGYER